MEPSYTKPSIVILFLFSPFDGTIVVLRRDSMNGIGVNTNR